MALSDDADFLKAFPESEVSLKEADKTVDIVVMETKSSIANESAGLQRAPRGTYEIAQHGDVRSIGSDSSRVHRKPEALRQLQVDAGVIQLRKAESLRGEHAIEPRRINRAGWTVMSPRAARRLVEPLPIVFAPGRHTIS